MKYMLDTNICIYVIRQKPAAVVQKFLEHDPNEICVSAITHAELMYGVEKSQFPERNLTALTLFLSSISVLEFDLKAAMAYGKIRAGLERNGTPVGAMDMLIAAHAQSEGITLVTNNTREFSRIDDLQIENWA